MAEEREPRRIQRRRTKGWRMPPNTVCVDRPSVWGNPFDWRKVGREKAIALYREWMIGVLTPEMYPFGHDAMKRFRVKYTKMTPKEAARTYLKGWNVATWCREGEACHGDVVLEIANA